MDRITAHYFIETPYQVAKAAMILAGEQSSGTFVETPGETPALKQRFGARIENIELLESVNQPAIPGPKLSFDKYHRALVSISWSVENFGYNLPVLISTLQGNLYEITQFTGLKLMDIDFPASYVSNFQGPRFGIKGTRNLMGVASVSPMIGTIIKPSIGMDVATTASIVKTLLEAGIDFIKDDELMGSAANSPFDQRVDAIMKVIRTHADRTGKKVMYAFNISAEVDAMQRNYDKIVEQGGTCAMVSINSVGLAAVKKICDRGELAIHGHRNGWGMLNRHPLLGIEFKAYQKIWRLAGVDQIHVNGIKNKFWEADESVVRSIASCLDPLGKGMDVLPVVSSGQWGGQAFETYQKTKTTDLLYMAGGGIMAHPAGPTGGVRAIKQAWQAAIDGWDIQRTAEKYTEFAQSVEKFGKG
ncbi:ribulose-bisphosphate carboxylase large subunit family protein [Belliella sp. DSM 111904]|uniref:Ribulose-bisphosphate carboxylase large subunit family protein n=1 Tax=Belliella filtrata TaxID=2923435 RepID=A0ABS9UVA8_9BACT|nr:ribulose-bisphosphate carboxylase large subunit family protein [Belliella filtrata]MCH7408108.1 ribulose-bisphosphate carboxylase large subunit family protein [Belliella filtrata]